MWHFIANVVSLPVAAAVFISLMAKPFWNCEEDALLLSLQIFPCKRPPYYIKTSYIKNSYLKNHSIPS